jgi:4-diphosphocytidyl-2-C-methyl-D-erythritol kinase
MKNRIARAKINLSLDVIGKRANGYHDVRMVMQTIGLHDKLRLNKVVADKILMKTNLSYLPTDERNLVVKIIAYMKSCYNIKEGIYVDLYKVIPVGAGLAGGSTDAAATITGMNELFELNLTLEEMMSIGEKFGADIPYCLIGGTALAEGIGEKLTVLEAILPLHIVVAKPKVSVSTKYVYDHLLLDDQMKHPNIDGMVEAIEAKDLSGIAKNLGNVLEDVTIKGYPEVLEIKKAMMEEGALGALMSGSGSAVFGLFEDQRSAKIATKALKQNKYIRNVYETMSYNE